MHKRENGTYRCIASCLYFRTSGFSVPHTLLQLTTGGVLGAVSNRVAVEIFKRGLNTIKADLN